MRRVVVALGLATAVLVVVAGCGSTSSSSDSYTLPHVKATFAAHGIPLKEGCPSLKGTVFIACPDSPTFTSGGSGGAIAVYVIDQGPDVLVPVGVRPFLRRGNVIAECPKHCSAERIATVNEALDDL